MAYATPELLLRERHRTIEQQIREEILKAPLYPKYDPSIRAEATTREVVLIPGFDPSLKAEARVHDIAVPTIQGEYYRELTSEQESKIVGLAMQLPKAKRAKYVTVVEAPLEPAKYSPAWKTETVTGQVLKEGIAETLSARFLAFFGLTPTRIKVPLPPGMEAWERSSFEAQAGFVAIVESYWRPDIPTPVSAVIQKASGLQTAYETGEVGASYAFGGVLGTVAESYVFGKVLGLGYKGLQRITPQVIKQPLSSATQAITRTIKYSRVARTLKYSRVAMFAHQARLKLISLKPWVSKGAITRGEIALAGKEAFSLTRERVAQMAFELSVAPRTGAVWLTNIGLAPAKEKVLKHLISRGTQISVGYLREIPVFDPIWQRGLLPYVTQMQVTRLGITPYVPSLVSGTVTKAGRLVYPALGLAVPSLLKEPLTPTRLKPRKDERLETLMLPRLDPFLTERQAKKERATPTLLAKLTPDISLEDVQEPKIALDLAQAQVSKTVLTPILKLVPGFEVPPVTTLEPPVPPLRLPEFRERKGKDLDKFFRFKWFKKEHQVADPSVVLSKVFGDRPRTRTHKRRAKNWPFM